MVTKAIKRTATVFAGAIALGSLVGCGGGSPSTTTEGPASTATASAEVPADATIALSSTGQVSMGVPPRWFRETDGSPYATPDRWSIIDANGDSIGTVSIFRPSKLKQPNQQVADYARDLLASSFQTEAQNGATGLKILEQSSVTMTSG